MENNIREIAAVFEEHSLFIEFGSGSSIKTRLLLNNISELNGYIPIDISEEHLLKTAEQLKNDYPHINIYPLAADFTKPLELPAAAGEAEHIIVYFPGSTIGNFTKKAADEFLNNVSKLCGKDGGLLIGVDLIKDKTILEKAYNDSKGVTAAFNLNMLERLNREFNFNFNLSAFKHLAVFNEKKCRIEMKLFSIKDQTVSNGKQKFSFKEGENIITEYSHKYSFESFEQLAKPAFKVERIWTDENKRFSIQFLSVV
jgi:dimethylhistidine N-methyltransferase